MNYILHKDVVFLTHKRRLGGTIFAQTCFLKNKPFRSKGCLETEHIFKNFLKIFIFFLDKIEIGVILDTES
jgi:hypothetical protein